MFDYIIVGAGSAGCLLANRLSKNTNKRVCLLEAGSKDLNPLVHVPLGLSMLPHFKSLNWSYMTEKNKHLNDRQLSWSRGKVLGGSSSINAMVYLIGHQNDYDRWESIAGSQWGWDHAQRIFHHFQKDSNPDKLKPDFIRSINRLSQYFIDTCSHMGYSQGQNLSIYSHEGAGQFALTQKKGRRHSSSQAFLSSITNRKNLEIKTQTQVHKILFENKKAIGVRTSKEDILLNQGGEVILSGGSINSPQLLMLSGIGCAKHLKKVGITPLVDSPEVGKHLKDHLNVSALYKTQFIKALAITPLCAMKLICESLRYAVTRGGLLTSNVAETGGFFKSSPHIQQPDIQCHFLPTYLIDHGKKLCFSYGITFHMCNLLPKSEGHIELNPQDIHGAPLIHSNYLSHPSDMAPMVKGLKIAHGIAQEKPIRKYISQKEIDKNTFKNDQEIENYIRNKSETIYHPVGTCQMTKDEKGVVDPKGRVRGVENLRVADASVMPDIISGNTNVPTMMIGHRISEFILEK